MKYFTHTTESNALSVFRKKIQCEFHLHYNNVIFHSGFHNNDVREKKTSSTATYWVWKRLTE